MEFTLLGIWLFSVRKETRMQVSQLKLERIRSSQGFVAALDHSGGSTPAMLERYGISKGGFADETEMYDLIHEFRTRIMRSSCFTADRIIGVILFYKTMESDVAGLPTPQFLWDKRGILSILKVDVGLEERRGGISLLKRIPNLRPFLERALEKGVCATKMRSVINRATPGGINEVVAQQFEIAERIMKFGLVPIVEPEVSIDSPEKQACEELLHRELMDHLSSLDEDQCVALKLTPPERPNLYADEISHRQVVRVTALSGGYDRDEACRRLSENVGMIASFSRALTEGLHKDQTNSQFNATLGKSIEQIFAASAT